MSDTSFNKINNKRIAKNTLILYVRSIITMLVALFTTRVVLNALGVDNYGIYNIVGGMVAMFTMISSTLSSATQRFITYSFGENDTEKPHKVFCTSLTLHIIMGFIMILLLEVGGIWLLNTKLNIPFGRISAAHIVLQCSIFTLFISIISVPYNALIVAHERMSAFAYISIIQVFLKLGIALLLLIGDYDKLILYAILQLVISVIIRLIYSLYSRYHFIEARNISYRIDKSLFGQMFSFAGWNLLGNGSLVLRNQGVDVVLNTFFGVVVNAASGISNQVKAAVSQFSGNFLTALQPQLTIAVAKRDHERITTLVNQGTRFAFCLMSVIAVPVFVSCTEVLSLWLSEVPPYGVAFVRCAILYLLLDVQSRLLIHAVLSTGKIRSYQIVTGGTKLLAIPVVYIVLKLGGSPVTGIVVNIVLDIICFALRLFYNNRLLGLPVRPFIHLFFINWAVLLCSLSLPFIVYHYITSNLWIIAPFSFLSVIFCGYTLLLSEQERTMIRAQLIKFSQNARNIKSSH